MIIAAFHENNLILSSGVGVRPATFAGEAPSTYSFNYLPGADLPLSESGGQAGPGSYEIAYAYQSGSPLLTSAVATYQVPDLSGGTFPVSFELGFTPNGFGGLAAMDVNGAFTLSYDYDGLGRLTKLRRSEGAGGPGQDLISDMLYYPDGSLARIWQGNGMVLDFYQLYGTGAPTLAAAYPNSSNLPSREGAELYRSYNYTEANLWREQYATQPGDKYTLDNFLNPSQLSFKYPNTNSYTVAAGYDTEQQLTSASYSGAYNRTLRYEYDVLGNRSREVSGATVTTYLYDQPTNRLKMTVRDGHTTGFRHDPRGNIIESRLTRHVYAYDLLNRLVAVDGGKVRFAYLANGLKHLKLTTGDANTGPRATLYFYTPAGELIYEATYDRSTHALLSDTYYLHALGMLIGTLSSGGAPTPGFVSRQFDPDVGLYYLNARWYDPELGRFVSPDPIPGLLNQYAYAGNNPFRYSDANGLQAFDIGRVNPMGSYPFAKPASPEALQTQYMISAGAHGVLRMEADVVVASGIEFGIQLLPAPIPMNIAIYRSIRSSITRPEGEAIYLYRNRERIWGEFLSLGPEEQAYYSSYYASGAALTLLGIIEGARGFSSFSFARNPGSINPIKLSGSPETIILAHPAEAYL